MYLDNYLKDIEKLCILHQVKFLFAFGSVLTEDFDCKSDIDFIVDLKLDNPIDYGEHYFELKFQLEDLLDRSIDLLEQRGLQNTYLIEKISKSKRVIYET